MPIYEYRCENGHTFEVMQRITEDPVSTCTTCQASVQRVFHPIAVHFKGSGFYNTDYGTRKRAREQKESSGGEGSSSTSSNSDSGKSGSSNGSDSAAGSKKTDASSSSAPKAPAKSSD
jgi:putative FmdB family regulatory protein